MRSKRNSKSPTRRNSRSPTRRNSKSPTRRNTRKKSNTVKKSNTGKKNNTRSSTNSTNRRRPTGSAKQMQAAAKHLKLMKIYAGALKKKKKDLIKIISSPNNKISKGEFIKLNRSYFELNETYINILKKSSPHFDPEAFNKLKMGGKKTKKRGKTKRGKRKRRKKKTKRKRRKKQIYDDL